MKTPLLKLALTACLSLALCAPPGVHAAVTGRAADTSLSGTEKLLSDSSGADTYITLSTVWGTAQPFSAGITATGSSAWDFSAGTGLFKTSTGVNTFKGSAHNFDAVLQPTTNDAAALGTSALSFSDLFLASGALININNGNWIATHSSGILTVSTGDLRVTTAGTNTASCVTVGGSQTLTSKTLTSPVIATGLTASGGTSNDFSASTGTFKTSTGVNTFGGSAHNFSAVLQPTTDDAAALGTTSLGFSDIFLATGGTLHFGNTNWVATHTSGILTVGTGDLRVTTAGTNTASVVTVGGTQTLAAKTLTSPVIATGLTASGSAANTFAASSGTFITSTGVNTFKGSAHNFDAVLQPTTNDAAALGTTTLGFSDLFLATGGTLRFANTNWVATHTSGILTVGTGDLRVTTAGTNTASVVTVGGTQTLTDKTLTAPTITAFTATGTSTIGTGLTITTPLYTEFTESVTATNVITAAESGSTFLLNSATEFVSTLPAPAAGLRFTFIVVAAPSGASYTVVTNASANIIKGMQVCAADAAGDTGTADDTVTFADGQAVAGDMITVWSDGTSWFIIAHSRVAAGITFTTAS